MLFWKMHAPKAFFNHFWEELIVLCVSDRLKEAGGCCYNGSDIIHYCPIDPLLVSSQDKRKWHQGGSMLHFGSDPRVIMGNNRAHATVSLWLH